MSARRNVRAAKSPTTKSLQSEVASRRNVPRTKCLYVEKSDSQVFYGEFPYAENLVPVQAIRFDAFILIAMKTVINETPKIAESVYLKTHSKGRGEFIPVADHCTKYVYNYNQACVSQKKKLKPIH